MRIMACRAAVHAAAQGPAALTCLAGRAVVGAHPRGGALGGACDAADGARALSDAGADIFHCSQRRFWEPEFEGSSLNFAGWAKKLTGKPSISVGSVGLASDFIESLAQGKSSELAAEQSLENLAKRVADGEFDLIAVGRALLQDPNWVAKLEQGRDDEFEPFDVRSMMSLS